MADKGSSKEKGTPQRSPLTPTGGPVLRPPRFRDISGKEAHAGMIIDRRYRLVKKLGEGGMGIVWQATQEVIDRPVAIKLLHSSLITSPEVQARFEVEARAIGRLRHTNCVTLFDFGRSEALNSCFMVLEYVEGKALADLMTERDFTIDEIIQIGAQTADALDHAHQQGIIHRDVKPENIMLSGDDEDELVVKVLDFGIARIVDNTPETGDPASEQRQGRITRAGQVFGTPVYMAPEQATGKYTFGPQCDIYSLGIILYELIEGHPPFDDEQPVAILLKHATDPLPPIQRDDVPEELCNLIYEMLEKVPADRIATAREVKDRLWELERLLHPEVHLRASSSFVGISAPLPPLEDYEPFSSTPPYKRTPPEGTSGLPPIIDKIVRSANDKNHTKLIAVFIGALLVLLFLVVLIWSLTSDSETTPQGGSDVVTTQEPSTSAPTEKNADLIEPPEKKKNLADEAVIGNAETVKPGDKKERIVEERKVYEFVGPPVPPKEEKKVKKAPPRRRKPTRHHAPRHNKPRRNSAAIPEFKI